MSATGTGGRRIVVAVVLAIVIWQLSTLAVPFRTVHGTACRAPAVAMWDTDPPGVAEIAEDRCAHAARNSAGATVIVLIAALGVWTTVRRERRPVEP